MIRREKNGLFVVPFRTLLGTRGWAVRNDVLLGRLPPVAALDGSVGAAEEEKGAHRAVHATGFHEEPSASFLKCELVTNGCVKNCGSSTVLVTMSHVSPFGSESTL